MAHLKSIFVAFAVATASLLFSTATRANNYQDLW